MWFVGTDMCDLLESETWRLPLTEFHWDVPPDPRGVVAFEAPLTAQYQKGRTMATALWAHLGVPQEDWDPNWRPSRGPELDQMAAELRESVEQVEAQVLQLNEMTITDEHPFPPSLALMTWARSATDGLTIMSYAHDESRSYLMPLGQTMWQQGTAQDWRVSSEAEHNGTVEDRRHLLALWLLATQTGVATTTTEGPQNRAEARRAARQGGIEEVRIVHLREAPPGDGTPREGGRAYQHRWMVSGHWRNQPYGPNSELRRPAYINPLLKGPEGAPLLAKETVKAWIR